MLTYQYGCYFGADPEIFLRSKKTGRIIGSELVIPQEGIQVNSNEGLTYRGKIVRDGVQVELQPYPASCRQTFSHNVKQLLLKLEEVATAANCELCYDTVVTMEEKELARLSPKSRVLGCQPSENIYGPSPIGVPSDYPVRSAGGHIHLGYPRTSEHTSGTHAVLNTRPVERLIALMDICVGIPGVILDRSERAAERRQVYGRAGEHRLQPHGIEYRTLSNFWLRAYPLSSLMLALARMAMNIQLGTGRTVYTKIVDWEGQDDLAPSLLSLFDAQEVQHTINTNDLDMAWANMHKLQSWLNANTHTKDAFPLTTPGGAAYFQHVAENLDRLFPTNTQHWQDNSQPEGVGAGWERLAADHHERTAILASTTVAA